MELSDPKIKKTSYIFSKESFSYISEEGNPEKIPYISGNGTFLYSGKQKFSGSKNEKKKKKKKKKRSENFFYISGNGTF